MPLDPTTGKEIPLEYDVESSEAIAEITDEYFNKSREEFRAKIDAEKEQEK